jgi:hypothetical protein
LAAVLLLWRAAAPAAAGQSVTNQNMASTNQTVTNVNAPLPHQVVSTNAPPLPPSRFNPDPGNPPFRTNIVLPPPVYRTNQVTSRGPPPLPPSRFNPDPGAMFRSPAGSPPPFFTNDIPLPPAARGPALPPGLAAPRGNVYDKKLEVVQLPPVTNNYGQEPLPPGLALPRSDTRANQRLQHEWGSPDYAESRGYGAPPFAAPATNRWRLGFMPWRRYTSGDIETPYETPDPMIWSPYKPSFLKGDAPVIGQDIFLDLTARSETDFEARSVPTPGGVSAALPNDAEFFGRSEQYFVQNNFSFKVDLFKGYAAFQPVQWAVVLEPVFNVNYTDTRENGILSPNAAKGTGRTDDFLALQEAFAEFHLRDLSDNYDFLSARLGLQPFNSDFRGFIFNDVNSGARVFGNADDNRWQYNLAAFDMREKDSNSGLNSFDDRDQTVIIANAYRQDFLWHGYTAQWSLHLDQDDGRTHYDSNGNLVRPELLGTVAPHDVNALYFGWAGDGHIGRLNLSHAFYEVIGRDSFNGLAGHPVEINAQMAALEASYDSDWIRYKASLFYASGNKNPTGGTATGFDSILDNPNFTGGPFSWWVHQGVGLAGTSVNLKQPDSLVPDLRSSKIEGQANFNNPGLFMPGLGTETEVTPRLRNFVNVNFIRFMDTEPIKSALFTDKADRQFGWDLSTGFQYRPLLTDNIIVSAGFGVLLPMRGYKDIYQTNPNPVPGYGSPAAAHVDNFLYNVVLAVTFTY